MEEDCAQSVDILLAEMTVVAGYITDSYCVGGVKN